MVSEHADEVVERQLAGLEAAVSAGARDLYQAGGEARGHGIDRIGMRGVTIRLNMYGDSAEGAER